MSTSRGLIVLACVVLAAGVTGCARESTGDTYDTVLARFQDPPAEFRSSPLWVWNDRMTRDEIRDQLTDFKARGIGGVFIHPRPGLITPYLSEEWFSLCRYAVETGSSLGLKIWLYDENSYPSGFAGGHVPARMPDAARSGLRMTKLDKLPESFERPPLVVLRKTIEGMADVTGKVRPGTDDGASTYYVFDVVPQPPSPWFGGFTYVDIMRKAVTEMFIDVTLNAYKAAIGADFGTTVPGVFQDEAEIAPPGGADMVNYTPALFQAFLAKWGYDLRPRLVSLFEESGDWRRVRHNYYSTLLDLFIENWAKPYYAYCTDNNLKFTGHYWEHEWPVPRVSPDTLAMAAYAHMPGIDILMNDWGSGPHAQFGNDRAVREIRSSANQLGRTRTMSETFGAGGWDMTFFDQKRIADWEYALGVNFMNQHLSYVTIMGARKRDHPLSFSYHEPWWPLYGTLADYYGRLSVVMSSGRQVNRVLVVEPTTTGWTLYAPGRESERFASLGNDFQEFIHLLEAEQIEYDLASEKTLEEFGAVAHRRISVGQRAYDLVILPPGLENLNNYTVTLLRDFLIRDGKLVSWVAPPDYVDGRLTEDIRLLAASYADRWFNVGSADGFALIRRLSPSPVEFRDLSSRALLFHQRREFDRGRFVFLANTHPVEAVSGRLALEGMSLEEWDPFTGSVKPYPFDRRGGKLETGFTVPPGGSLLLCATSKRARSAPVREELSEPMTAEGPVEVRRESPNVLTLDYCDLTLGGKVERELYFYDAQKKTYAFHGLGRNPWDSAVQYRTNILDKDRFGPDSGFEAAFRFDAVKEDVEDFRDLKAVVERPELWSVSINGHDVEPLQGKWWLDKAFAVYDIGPRVVSGRNRILVRCKPFTINSELEPVYLLGDFALAEAAKGFELRPAGPLSFGPWASQGLPMCSGTVAYRKTFSVPMEGAPGTRYVVKLGSWRGAAAEVRVGGRSAGTIAFAPYGLDITRALAAGPNEVEVVVYGTLKNTLGPFHNNPPLGRAWPGSFQQGAEGGLPPGAEYSVVDYGLFEDFAVIRITGR